MVERGNRLAMRRAQRSPLPDLTRVEQSFVPDLAPDGVMGEPFDLLVRMVTVQRFNNVDNPRMKSASLILQQSPVRNLMRESVFEGVLDVRKQPGLVEELGALQIGKATAKRLIGEP